MRLLTSAAAGRDTAGDDAPALVKESSSLVLARVLNLQIGLGQIADGLAFAIKRGDIQRTT